MMEIFEVRHECPDETYPVVMEGCVNKNMDETHRDISEHDIETNWDAMKVVIEEFPDGHGDDEEQHHRIKTKL